MKKIIFFIALTILHSSCASTMPKTPDEVMSAAEYNVDNFQNTEYVTFPVIYMRNIPEWRESIQTCLTKKENLPGPTFKYLIVALLDGSKKPLHFQLICYSWESSLIFYSSAKNNNGTPLNFTRYTPVIEGTTVIENFAIDFSVQELEKLKSDNWIMKVYGTYNSFVFMVPQYYLEGVYNYFYSGKKDNKRRVVI